MAVSIVTKTRPIVEAHRLGRCARIQGSTRQSVRESTMTGPGPRLRSTSCSAQRRATRSIPSPPRDPDRPRSFRTREFARIGSSEQVHAFRASWIDRLGLALFAIHSLEPNLWNEDARAVLDLGSH